MQARPLFTIAAAFNLSVAAGLVVAGPDLTDAFGLPGRGSLWTQLIAACIAIYGYSYWCVSREPARYREYVVVGVLGKVAFVALILGHSLAGTARPLLAGLVSVDIVFMVLFVRYLRQSRNPVV